jgi:hypothetical protein
MLGSSWNYNLLLERKFCQSKTGFGVSLHLLACSLVYIWLIDWPFTAPAMGCLKTDDRIAAIHYWKANERFFKRNLET